jgi:threonine/homoserine/homoserine lactone efflux protein
VCFGLGAVFSRMPQLQVWLAWVGATYLVYIAWKLVGAGAVGESTSARPLTLLEAALFQPANPKGWVTTITTAALFVPKTGNRYWAIGLIIAVSFAVMLPSNIIWTAFGSSLRAFLDDPRRRRAFNIVMALLLVGTAAVLVLG